MCDSYTRNSTFCTSESCRHLEFIASEVGNGITAICLLYVLCSLIAYHVDEMTRKTFTRKKRVKYLFSRLMIANALIAFLKAFFDVAIIWLRIDPMWYCSNLKKVKIALATFSFWLTFFIFWCRQRVFYHTSALLELDNSWTRTFSWLTLIVLCGMFLVGGLFYGITASYSNPGEYLYGCTFTARFLCKYVTWDILICALAMLNAAILTQFLFPLIEHRRLSVRVLLPQSSSGKDKTLGLIHRSLIFSSIFIATFTIAGLFLASVTRPADDLTHSLSTIVLFVGLMCVIMSFASWKQRLFPWMMFIRGCKGADKCLPTIAVAGKATGTTALQE